MLKHCKYTTFGVLITLLVTSNLSGQNLKGTTDQTPVAGQGIKAKIDVLLKKKYQDGKLNGNILVVKNGKTIYEKSFGYANGSKSALLTKKDKFGIGSVYKEFPAVAIMQLYEKKQLKLEDKASQYITDLPDWGAKISIKNLLQYTSGLPKVGWRTLFSSGKSITEKDLFAHIQSIKKLRFEPGSDYLYTNCSPLLLMKVVENIARLTFDQYLTKHILKPFNLPGIVLKNHYPYQDKSSMALPFNSSFVEDKYKMSAKSLLFAATAQSLHQWFRKLSHFEVISERSLRHLAKKYQPAAQFQAPLGNVIYDDKNKEVEHAHHGSNGNYECLVRYFKPADLSIVVLTNQKHRNVHHISQEIYEIINGQKK